MTTLQRQTVLSAVTARKEEFKFRALCFVAEAFVAGIVLGFFWGCSK